MPAMVCPAGWLGTRGVRRHFWASILYGPMPEATRMRISNDERADDPLRRFRAGWRLKARHAKDTWTSGTEPIETAMESTFLEGVAFAVELLEKEGHRELANKISMRVQPKL